MKPSEIHSVLNLALQARANDDKFNPLFVGPPGIGKSEIVQQWCKSKNLPFIDLRAAYLEAPDLIGFPTLETVNGKARTIHAVPDFWPDDGEGVILLEEPNRGTTSVMNTFMQLLTDRKVHNYKLPDGWIIVGCINPESEEYDVATMDPALKNRFEIIEVEYDQETFLKYAADQNWDERIVLFVRGNFWRFIKPESVAKENGAKYVSPRSFSKLNAALKAGLTELPEQVQMSVFESILGKSYGIQFYNFISKESPVFVKDLLENFDEAIERLKHFSNPEDYKNGHISMFVEDVKRNHEQLSDELLASICLAIPSDQSAFLIRELSYLKKLKANELFDSLCKKFPELKKYLSKNLKAK